MTNSDFERRLRATLAEHAEGAPSGVGLDDRILDAVRGAPAPARRRNGWSTWSMPLLAAAAVAAIVGGVFLVVAQVRPDASPGTGVLNSGSPQVTSPRPHTSPATSKSPTSATSSTGGPSAATSSSSAAAGGNSVGVANFAASDLTFYGSDNAWAIGTATCLDSSGGRCPAMVRSTDGGHSWHSMPPPPGKVTNIRFATPQIGYAYSASILEMSTNGGKTWQRQSGGAVALETLDNNVIRVAASPVGGCPPGCTWTVSTAAIGSSTWTRVALPGDSVPNVGVSLVRSEHYAYLDFYNNLAGGGSQATSVLFRSADDGRTWARVGEPCRLTKKFEVDSIALAAAPGGVTALCQVRQVGSGGDFVAVSVDHGAHFAGTAGRVPQFGASLLAGDPKTVLVAAGRHAYRSTDGGKSWVPIAQITGTATFVGFESTTLGRVVTDGGHTIWTTSDGGANWSAYRFP